MYLWQLHEKSWINKNIKFMFLLKHQFPPFVLENLKPFDWTFTNHWTSLFVRRLDGSLGMLLSIQSWVLLQKSLGQAESQESAERFPPVHLSQHHFGANFSVITSDLWHQICLLLYLNQAIPCLSKNQNIPVSMKVLLRMLIAGDH